MTAMERKGIISVGNWIADSVKFIERYPSRGNLTTISRVEVGLGGCAHNVLVDLASMRSGIPLYAGGCVGDDAYGRMVLDAIERHGIDRSDMSVLPGVATSYTDVMSESGGGATRTFFHFRGANAELTPGQVLATQSPARIFHLGYLLLLDRLDADDADYGVAAARVLHELQKRGYRTSVDVVSEEGSRFCRVVLPCLPYTDYLIVNEVEAGACCRTELRDGGGRILPGKVAAAARQLLGMGINRLCVIHFPEGGFAMDRQGRSEYVPALTLPREQIVSAVGAGDAFCAGALYAIHERYTLRDMLIFANTCARFNLASATSTGGAPTLEQIRKFISENY